MGSSIMTFKGNWVDPVHLSPSDVQINDIAVSLSRLCRFCGHGKVFYSVAEHSVRVARILPKGLRLEGLLHDATEGYGFNDVCRPVKHTWWLWGYRFLEKRAAKAIRARFELSTKESFAVKVADRLICQLERARLFDGVPTPFDDETDYFGLLPEYAERLFLKTYDAILRGEDIMQIGLMDV